MRDPFAATTRPRLSTAFFVFALCCIAGSGTAAAAPAASFRRAGEASDSPEAGAASSAKMGAGFDRRRRRRRRRTAAPEDGPASAREVEKLLRRVLHREAQQPPDEGGRASDRNLIYEGQPTGGNKYPFLVSMWSWKNDVRSVVGHTLAQDLGQARTISSVIFSARVASLTQAPLRCFFDQVQNKTTLVAPTYCHGVMVTDDLFVSLWWCRWSEFSTSLLCRLALRLTRRPAYRIPASHWKAALTRARPPLSDLQF